MRLSVSIPIRVVSEANQSWHQSRFAKARRVKRQRGAVAVYLRATLARAGLLAFPLPARVTFTRVAARQLDTDNLAGAFKAVRDAVARELGADDSPSAPVEWAYRQERKTRREAPPSIRIEIEALPPVGPVHLPPGREIDHLVARAMGEKSCLGWPVWKGDVPYCELCGERRERLRSDAHDPHILPPAYSKAPEAASALLERLFAAGYGVRFEPMAASVRAYLDSRDEHVSAVGVTWMHALCRAVAKLTTREDRP